LDNAFVVVVGLGGVGSHAANMLVRSGIGRIRLIDFDQVTLSSLNRHAMASMADVGYSKAGEGFSYWRGPLQHLLLCCVSVKSAEVMKRKLLEIVPWARVEAITEMFRGSEAERLLTETGRPTFVLDCIDDVATKADLIAFCTKEGLPILTSMGAGGKSDPTKLRIAPLSECINDPLAAKIKVLICYVASSPCHGLRYW
jgi:tRNA A37 threonylcarbamoyladenosine dehydratase